MTLINNNCLALLFLNLIDFPAHCGRPHSSVHTEIFAMSGLLFWSEKLSVGQLEQLIQRAQIVLHNWCDAHAQCWNRMKCCHLHSEINSCDNIWRGVISSHAIHIIHSTSSKEHNDCMDMKILQQLVWCCNIHLKVLYNHCHVLTLFQGNFLLTSILTDSSIR